MESNLTEVKLTPTPELALCHKLDCCPIAAADARSVLLGLAKWPQNASLSNPNTLEGRMR